MTVLAWIALGLAVLYATYEAWREDWQIAGYWLKKDPRYRQPK